MLMQNLRKPFQKEEQYISVIELIQATTNQLWKIWFKLYLKLHSNDEKVNYPILDDDDVCDSSAQDAGSSTNFPDVEKQDIV